MLAPGILVAARAVLALALGLVITFTGGHTATFGLVAFGVFAVLSGLLLLAGAFGARASAEAGTAFRAAGVVSVVAGAAALVLPTGGTGYLIWVVSGWAIVTGALELFSGIRARARMAGWTDWVVVGALTVLLGVVALVIPPDIADSFDDGKGGEGFVTAPIIVIGMLGAWAVITGVLQAIAAASPRIARGRAPHPETTRTAA